MAEDGRRDIVGEKRRRVEDHADFNTVHTCYRRVWDSLSRPMAPVSRLLAVEQCGAPHRQCPGAEGRDIAVICRAQDNRKFHTKSFRTNAVSDAGWLIVSPLINYVFPTARHPTARCFSGCVTLRETACPNYTTAVVASISDTSPTTHLQYLSKRHWPQNRHGLPGPYKEEARLPKRDFWKKVSGRQVLRSLIGHFLTQDD